MVTTPPAAKAGCHHSKHAKESQKMTYQIRPLFHEILQVIRKANIPFDALLPAQVKTITAVRRLHTDSNPFVGMAIPPGRVNTLIRPKTFLVKTTRLDHHTFITTYNIVVMDAAGDLRLVEDFTANDTKAVISASFIDQVARLVEEQAAFNHTTPMLVAITRSMLSDTALHIANIAKPRWARWVIYILEVLQDHAEPIPYDVMLTELSLAIEIRQLEGSW